MREALLVDDNLMSATRVAAQLQQAGYNVRTVRAMPPAGTDSLANDVQLVLINLGSRSIDGIGCINAARERYAEARIVGFCGHLEVEIRRAAKAAGIDKILTNDQAYSQLQDSL